MKKLMILSLVMAIGGLANAGLSLVVVNNEVSILLEEGSLNLMGYDVEVSIDAGVFDSSAADFNPSGKGWQAAAKVAEQTGNTYRVTAADFPQFGGSGLAAPAYILTGLVVTDAVEYTVTLTSVTGVQFADGTRLMGELASVYVPEPMTMGLLGVGALFLRRRK